MTVKIHQVRSERCPELEVLVNIVLLRDTCSRSRQCSVTYKVKEFALLSVAVHCRRVLLAVDKDHELLIMMLTNFVASCKCNIQSCVHD